MSAWGTLVYGQSLYGPGVPGLCITRLQQPNRSEVRAMFSALQANVIEIEARFSTRGVYADPNTVILKLKKPDGTLVSPQPTMTKVSTGVYTYPFDTEGQAAGTWTYRAEGEGLCDCSAEGTFEIQASAFS